MKESGKEKQSRGQEERGRSRKGEGGEAVSHLRAVGSKGLCWLGEPSIAHTKASNAVIDNYLDSICLISLKWLSVTREWELLNYWCGISKEEPRKYANKCFCRVPRWDQVASLLPFTHLGGAGPVCSENSWDNYRVWTAGDPGESRGS